VAVDVAAGSGVRVGGGVEVETGASVGAAEGVGDVVAVDRGGEVADDLQPLNSISASKRLNRCSQNLEETWCRRIMVYPRTMSL
jgi:hypothetical protein